MILLDTDVLIDIALDRLPYSGPASELLDKIEQGVERAFIAWHTVSNLYYIVTPAIGEMNARDFIVELTSFVAVASTDTEGVRYAADMPPNCRCRTSRTPCRWPPPTPAAPGT